MAAFQFAFIALCLYIAAVARAIASSVTTHSATALGVCARGATHMATFCDAQRAKLQAKAAA